MDLDRLLIRLSPKQDRRLKSGYPWAFSNEIAMTPALRATPPGTIVRLEGDDGWRFGTFMFNPHSLIAARRLDRDPTVAIDATWLHARLAEAVALRALVTDSPFHRLIHAEADGMPGLIIDRFGEVVGAAGQYRRHGPAAAATSWPMHCSHLLPLRAIVARNDAASRARMRACRPKCACSMARTPSCVVDEAGVVFPGRSARRAERRGFSSTSDRTGIGWPDWRAAPGCWTCSATRGRSACGRPVPARPRVTLVDSSQPALDHAMDAAARNGFQAVTPLGAAMRST